MAQFKPLIYFKRIWSLNWTLSISNRNGEDPDPEAKGCREKSKESGESGVTRIDDVALDLSYLYSLD